MYRYIMIQHERQRVTVAEELRLVGFYTEVLKMRFVDQLEVAIIREKGIDPETNKKQIIPFSIQMLLENATKHNVIRAGCPMRIEIRLLPDGIRVTNPIRSKQVLPPSGIGLSLGYLKKLYSYYNKDFKVENDGKTFTVFAPYLD